jgi:hypothetical protein
VKICPSCSARQANDVLVCSSCGHQWGDRQPKKTMMGIPAVFDQAGAEAHEDVTMGADGSRHTLFGIPAMRAGAAPEEPGATQEVSAEHVAEAIRRARLAHGVVNPEPVKPFEDSTREISAREIAGVLSGDRLGRPAPIPDEPTMMIEPIRPVAEGGSSKTAFGLPAVTAPVSASPPSPQASEPAGGARSTMFGLPKISVEQGPEYGGDEGDSGTQTGFGLSIPRYDDPQSQPRALSLDESSEELRTEVASPGIFGAFLDDGPKSATGLAEPSLDEEPVPRRTMMGMSLADMQEQAEKAESSVQFEAVEEPRQSEDEKVEPASDLKSRLRNKLRSLSKNDGSEGDPDSTAIPGVTKPAVGAALPRPSLPKPSLPQPTLKKSDSDPSPASAVQDAGDEADHAFGQADLGTASGVIKPVKREKEKGEREGDDPGELGVGGLGIYKVGRSSGETSREYPFGEVVPSVKKLRLDPALRGGQGGVDEEAELAAGVAPIVEPPKPSRTAFPTGPAPSGESKPAVAPPVEASSEAMPEIAHVEAMDEDLPLLDVEPPSLASDPSYAISEAIEDVLFDEPMGSPPGYPEQPWAETPAAAAPMEAYEPYQDAGMGAFGQDMMEPPSVGYAAPTAQPAVPEAGGKLPRMVGIFAGVLLLAGGGLGLAGVAAGSVAGFAGVSLPMVMGLFAIALPFLPVGPQARHLGFIFAGFVGLAGFAAALGAEVANAGPLVQLAGAVLAVGAAVLGVMSKSK